MIALRWRDINIEDNLIHVAHSIWHKVEGDTKAAGSRKPVPLPVEVVAELEKWWAASLCRSDDDILFPSTQKNGKQPLQPEMILRRHIRPALQRLGINKTISRHSFRHGLANLPRQNGVDVKVVRELLRHANSRITLDICQQTGTEGRRIAQALVFRDLLEDPRLFQAVNPSAPQNALDSGQKEDVVPASA